MNKHSLLLKDYSTIKGLNDIYTFKNYSEIKSFLIANKRIIGVLDNSHKEINKIFSDNIDYLSLEYHKDPEENYECIFILIKTNVSFSESLELLNKFYKEYWFNLSNDIKKIVGISIDNNSNL